MTMANQFYKMGLGQNTSTQREQVNRLFTRLRFVLVRNAA
jgi:hypothetical protein